MTSAGLCLTAAPVSERKTFFSGNLMQGIFKGSLHYYKYDSSLKTTQRRDWSIEDVNQNSSKSYDCALRGESTVCGILNGDIDTVFAVFRQIM